MSDFAFSMIRSYGRMLQIYRQMLRRHPAVFIAALLVYCGVVLSALLHDDVAAKWRSFTGRDRADERIKALETLLERQQLSIETLTKRTSTTSFLRSIEFKENWLSDNNQTEILRLIEYADFAAKKNDFARAIRLYEEAGQIQDTFSVPYFLGRLSYLQGDLVAAETNWRRVIKLDAERRYPEVRLYLGIVLYEMGKERESKEMFEEYLRGTAL